MQNTTALAVFAAAFGVYLIGCAPLIAAGDAGELVSAAWLLGVPHPPGYPLFCVMGRLFSFLPFGNVAYRMNLMSGFFCALAALFVYLTAIELTCRGDCKSLCGPLLSAAAALTLAYTGTYWGQATYSEVYPIQTALSAAALYYAVKAGNARDFRYVCLSCLVFGLSVAGHYSGLLIAPGLLVYFLLKFEDAWDLKKAVACVLSVFMGLSSFVYLVPRAAAKTAINWGDIHSLSGFARHVTRASYGDLSALLSGIFAGRPSWYMSGSVMVFALIVLAVAGFIAARKWGRPGNAKLLAGGAASATILYLVVLSAKGITAAKVSHFAHIASSDGWPFLICLSAAGLVYLFYRDRGAMLLFGLSLAVTLTVSVYRIPVYQGATLVSFSDKFFVPLLVLCGALSGAGLYGIISLAPRSGGAWKAAPSFLCAALLALVVWLFAYNYAGHDQSGYYYAHDYADNLLKGMGQDAVLMVEGDNVPSLMAYRKLVEKSRPDVDIFETTPHVFPPFGLAIPIYAEGKRPLYYSEATNPDAFPGIKLSVSGMLARFPGPPVWIADPWEYYYARIDASGIDHADFATREVIANHLYFRGLHLAGEGRRSDAVISFDGALRAGYDMAWPQYLVGIVMRNYYAQTDRAVELFRAAAGIQPAFVDAHIEMGRTLLMTGDIDRAVEILEDARKLGPNRGEVYCLLEEAMEKKGDRAEAARFGRLCREHATKGNR